VSLNVAGPSNVSFVPAMIFAAIGLIATLAGLIWLVWWLYEHLAWVA
jgi:hypothetical protein